MTNEEYTDFGFKKVLKKNKDSLVKNVFDSVANKYDVMNDFMSLGTHRLWKKHLVSLLLQTKHNHLIDVGGGTADIALEFVKQSGGTASVIDINQNMLAEGQEKVKKNGYYSSFNFINGNAEELPLTDNFGMLYSSSFCLRNVADLQKAIDEAFRVLQSGGKFFCLEFSKVNNPLFKKVYDVWSFGVIPKIGKTVANNQQAYEYLVESIRKFKTQDEFVEIIKNSGFVNVSYTNIFNGVVAIHTAQKP